MFIGNRAMRYKFTITKTTSLFNTDDYCVEENNKNIYYSYMLNIPMYVNMIK